MKRIGIIGCGNMGAAILKGIVSDRLASAGGISVSDVDSAKLDRLRRAYGLDVTFNNRMVAETSDIVIMAVKPQDIEAALGSISGCFGKKKLLISVAAGVTIKRIRSMLGEKAAVARAMPNMPALIREGFSAVAFSKGMSREMARSARAVFASIGDVVEVKENDLDAITAVSGSGPAYFFYLTEILVKSGVRLGLRPDVARKAAVKTALGSARLLASSKREPSSLRKRVTSKGGTTEAAFEVFRKRRLEAIVEGGITAAKKRSKQLSRGK